MFKCSRAPLKNLWKKLSESILYRTYSDIKFSMVSFKLLAWDDFPGGYPILLTVLVIKVKIVILVIL